MTAVAAIMLFFATHTDACPGRCAEGIRRHHGLGEGGYCNSQGVRRFHGLGDGYWYEIELEGI